MKRWIALLLALCLMFCLGCSKETAQTPETNPETGDTTKPQKSEESTGETQETLPETDETEEAENTEAEEEEQYYTAGNGYTLIEDLETLNQESGAMITQPTSVEFFEITSATDGDGVYRYNFLADNALCMLYFSADFEKELIEGIEFPDGEGTVTTDNGTYARWITVDGEYVLYCQNVDPDFFPALVQELQEGSVRSDS